MNLDAIRKEYLFATLEEKDVKAHPFDQFKAWLDEAIHAEVYYPTAMSLVTIGTDEFPQSRIVLLKDFNQNGFTFFTNYDSAKGQAIKNHPHVGLHFFWPELERQVRVSGHVCKTPEMISDQYFHSRPFESRVAAMVSNQSRVIHSRKELEKTFHHQLASKTKTQRPSNWGGYLVKPVRFEFWQGRENRLHDRIVYEGKENTWQMKRLAP